MTQDITIGKNGRIYPLGKDHPCYNPNLHHNKDPMGICECGCGEQFIKYHPGKVVTRFKRGHQYKSPDWAGWCYKWDRPWHNVELISCACGCGEKIPRYDVQGTEHRWKEGHHLEWLHKKIKGVLQGIRTPDDKLKSVHQRQARARYYYFNFYNGKRECIINDKQICTKKLCMFFIDGDTFNFAKENISMMCLGHCMLMKRYGLELNELRSIKSDFDMGPGNKHRWRRWLKNRDRCYMELKSGYSKPAMRKVLSNEQGDYGRR